MEHSGLPFFEYPSVTFDEIFKGQFGGAFGCLHTRLSRGISRIGRLDDRSDIDDERQWFVLTNGLTPRCLAVGQFAGNVELQLCAGLHPDEAVVPPSDHLCFAERTNGEGHSPVIAVVEFHSIKAAHTDVVDNNGVTKFRLGPVAWDQHVDLELLWRLSGKSNVGWFVRARRNGRRLIGVIADGIISNCCRVSPIVDQVFDCGVRSGLGIRTGTSGTEQGEGDKNRNDPTHGQARYWRGHHRFVHPPGMQISEDFL